jgi:hypothetical protein
VERGLNFEEQWNHALKTNPQFIFVTGWNEWVAGRYASWSKYTDKDCYFYPGGLFVDQYTQEYSRDCEPMRAGHEDNYYYQLAGYVRRFKGVRPMPSASGPSQIQVDGNFHDWEAVQPEFRDTIGDTIHRNHRGYGSLIYQNDTGRNDFVICKAAYDSSSLFFFAQTLNKITPRTGPHWMLLFLDTDQNARTGWLGYDFVINEEVLDDAKTTVKKWESSQWKTVGKAHYCINGNGLELSIDRSLIDLKSGKPRFDFHWADNIKKFGDISEFGVNGDSAPNRRFNYRFYVK